MVRMAFYSVTVSQKKSISIKNNSEIFRRDDSPRSSRQIARKSSTWSSVVFFVLPYFFSHCFLNNIMYYPHALNMYRKKGNTLKK